MNGLALQGLSHSEAISVFKNIRAGRVVLHVARRETGGGGANASAAAAAAQRRYLKKIKMCLRNSFVPNRAGSLILLYPLQDCIETVLTLNYV